MSYEHTVQGTRCRVIIVVLVGLWAVSGGCTNSVPATDNLRPEHWAGPAAVNPGLPNLHRVNSSLYRSSQASHKGFMLLAIQPSLANADRPIKTVVSLRTFTDDDSLVPASFGVRLSHIRFKTSHPEDEVKFLCIAITPALQPVLVHCQHGSDRTGTMVTIYRIAFEDWTKAQAG